MRTPGRDRRGSRIPALCAALILLAALFYPVSALDANFFVAENGSMFHAEIDIHETDKFEFNEPGLLGEKIPVEVSNVTLLGESGDKNEFEEHWGSISFEKGNYTVEYDQRFGNKDFRVLMDAAYNITLHLPEKYRVTNPLLGTVSTGGSVDEGINGSIISWEKRKYAEARFYDDLQEKMLLAFGSFWIVLVLIFLVPYLLTRWRRE